jgi:hypothetical protein
MAKKKSNTSSARSKCCNAKVRAVMSEDFFGDTPKTQRIGTCHYECLKCKEACDVYYKERVVANRNTETQVHKDKRKKFTDKLTKEEIEFYRKNEDF